MKEVYILHNQDLLYLSKQGDWVPSTQAQSIWHTPYKDIALNTRVEQSIKNADLRIEIANSALNPKKHAIAEKATPQEVIDALTQSALSEAEANNDDLFGEQSSGSGSEQDRHVQADSPEPQNSPEPQEPPEPQNIPEPQISSEAQNHQEQPEGTESDVLENA